MKNLRSIGMLIFAFAVGVTLQLAQANEPRPLKASATVDVASLIDAAGATNTVAVPGASIGDFCRVSMAVDVVSMIVTCYVSAANVASVRVQNESGSTVDLASTTQRIEVVKSTQF